MPRDTWSKWHRIYSVNLILYKSSDLKPLSPLEVLGEFAKNRFGKNFPVAVYSSSTFLVNGDALILTDRLHTYLDLNSNGSPY